MILANAVFVLLFLFFDWAEYVMLNIGLFPVGSFFKMETHFPVYIYGEYSPPSVLGTEAFFLPNYLLLIFVLATITNLYFLFKLQKSNQP
jgi:hypothetical protein